ncbi:SpoIIE family protein phosphatase [Allorhizocola rhizosphaerae]|uniref:SpoIIE family protein phosphatase n=1 Tax=Allorhizocola rhizosphaerae TaxID=1872709 RepID=UPI000E3CDAEA|nr:SpoIIE family protein phosphatase [Allorhizocola rhizosphaerae]
MSPSIGRRWALDGARLAGWRPPVIVAVVAAAYALGSGCAWLLFNASASGAVFFPPAGVTVAALLLTTRRHWVWVLGAAGVVEFVVDVWQGLAPLVAAGYVATNVVEPLIGAILVRRFVAGRLHLTRPRDAIAFLGCAVGIGPMVGGLLGATTSALAMGVEWWAAWGQFWAGDGLAVLTLGAAIVGLGSSERRLSVNRVGWAALILTATVALTALGFWPRDLPLIYLPVPVVLAVGFRGQLGMVGAAGFLMAFVANLQSASGNGPWAVVAAQPRLESATLQLYIASVMLGSWCLAIAVAQRDQAQARSREEVAARLRLQALQKVTAGLAKAATSEQVIEVLVNRGVATIADHGGVAMLDASGHRLRSWGTSGLSPDVMQQYAIIDISGPERLPVVDVVRTGRPIELPSLADIQARYPAVAALHDRTGTRSVLVVPVHVADRVPGALAFAFRQDHAISEEVTSVARTLAELAGQALERAERYEADHEAAHRLQRSLLPDIAPSLPGVAAGVRYRPAERGRHVGGDWYDLFETPGNRVGIAVGDVVGHGLEAAITMSRLQQALRSVAQSGAGPAEVLDELETLSGTIRGADHCTIGYAEYSPSERTLTYACAGHPPPLLVTGQNATYLNGGRSQPLRSIGGAHRQAEQAVPDGAMVVWYSDGLVERRRESIATGLERLAAATRHLPIANPQACCDHLLAAMTDGHPLADDVVVACIRLDGPLPVTDTTDLRITLGTPAELAVTREALRQWARREGLAAGPTQKLVLTCNEALANAFEHAYHDRAGGPVQLRVVRISRRGIRVEVTDRGRWRSSGGLENRGRGLRIVASLASRTAINRGDTGTRVAIDLLLQEE